MTTFSSPDALVEALSVGAKSRLTARMRSLHSLALCRPLAQCWNLQSAETGNHVLVRKIESAPRSDWRLSRRLVNVAIPPLDS